MTAKIQVRRDTTANWNAGTPPTLDVGEIGLDTDLKQIKIGDNTNNWTALPWLGGTLPYFSSPSVDIDDATNRVTGLYRWAGIASITSGVKPAAPIDIKTADGGINMLVLKFGTTVMQHLWTDGDGTVTPKSYTRVWDGDVSAWRAWVPQNIWGISASEGVDVVAKSITLKDTATGLTVDGNSTLTGNVTVNGTTTLGNANLDIVTVQAGAVGAPIITTAGDTDTGIYFPAANEFAIATGGTAAITVNSSQDVNVAGVLTAAVGTWPQCVQNKITNIFSVTPLSTRPTNFDVGGITQFETTITPRFTTSKLLVRFSLCVSQVAGGGAFILARRINGNGVEIGSSTEPLSNRQNGIAPVDYDGDAITSVTTMSFEHLDAPNTTSAVTYALYVYRNGGASDVFINRTENDANNSDHERVTSTVTIQEFFA